MKRILVVEDDEHIRDALAMALEQEGYTVHLATDGGKALHLLDSIPLPDVILTDLTMHPMDGRTFLKKKNENPRLKQIPTIVLTGDENTRDIEEFVMKKPFELDRILHAVEVVSLKVDAAPLKKKGDVS